MRLTTIFDMGDIVTIDRDESLKGVVTAVNIRGIGLNVQYEISYIHNGCSYSPWVEGWRINKWAG
jgi:hypothetical protein